MLKRFPRSFEIENTRIGGENPCYVIAEGGVNHFGEQEKAFKLIDLAISSAANCYKGQHYNVDVLINPKEESWRTRLGSKQLRNEDIYNQYKYCKTHGFTYLCTPHDEYALGFIESEIKPAAYKIGSGEVNNHFYIAKIAKLGRPIILSTGMYSVSEIIDTVRVIYENGAPPLAVLHCVTQYPASPKNLNLRTISLLKEIFSGPVGYSDHSKDEFYPLIAAALGSDIIEKHITLDRDVPNAQDWKASLDEESFPRFVSKLRELESALDTKYFPPEDELDSKLWAAKSATAIAIINEGDLITESNCALMRPSGGAEGLHFLSIVGKKSRKNFSPGDQINLFDVEQA